MHAGSVLRVLRAGAFAAVCVVLAALGHAMTSGRDVPGWMLVVGWAGTAGAAWFLTGKERGALLVGALTVFTQVFLHTAFSVGQTLRAPMAAPAGHGHGAGESAGHAASHGMHGMDGMHGMSGSMSGHAHHMQSAVHQGMAEHAPAVAAGPGADAPIALHAGHADSAGMLAAHLLVALLSAWWMWGGERAVFQLLRAASARFFAPLVFALAPSLPAPIPVLRVERWGQRRAPRQLFLSHVIWLRGPPAGPAV
ncbi:PE-PGRS family protein [Streptomyces sp. HNM0575]|uniref:PE-PGRS family protein n=1 Tax=Streptomyces sp. HNM0575 TaxID=2716338 RepID=UPI00145DB7FF|nr:PE-PGRS family protein [Streptomyces sp. HNM0575]NLU72673.1 PE-PGRS family protein [Streptomyces sp. HNM0575]